jgi:hypothetical protein
MPFHFHRANSNKMNFFNELADSPAFGRLLALLLVDAFAPAIRSFKDKSERAYNRPDPHSKTGCSFFRRPSNVGRFQSLVPDL